MKDTIIVERQALLWARKCASEDQRYGGFAIHNLEALLFDMRGNGDRSMAVIKRLVDEGALVLNRKTIALGPEFEVALERRAPRRLEITPDDIAGWAGAAFYRRIGRDEHLGSSPWMNAALSELTARQAEGRLEKIEEIDAGRIRLADDWNEFVETGVLDIGIVQTLRKQVSGWSQTFSIGDLKVDELAPMAAHLNAGIANGFPGDLDIFMPNGHDVEDRATGNRLTPDLAGWHMTFYTSREEDDYEHKPLDLAHRFPDVIHLEINIGDELMILAGRGSHDAIVEAIHEAHVDGVGLSDGFNADAGALEYARDTFEQTGVMSLSFGDYFPHPVRDRETGRLLVMSYGEIVSTEAAAEMEAERDEDYLAGHYITANPRYEFLDQGALDFLTMAPRAHLRKLLAQHGDMDEDAADALLTEQAADGYGKVYSFADLPETVHVYIPHGRAIDKFEAACAGSGLKDGLSGGDTGVLISAEPVTFAPEFKVMELEVAAPAIEEDASFSGVTP